MLDPRIEAIRAAYDLDRGDFWELPQKKGTWLVKHAALEVVSVKAGITFELPVILEAGGGDGIAALCVRGFMGDRSEWATGEASPKNCKNAYPWAMAEKRAKDRVILKLVGIHGLVYSEDEAEFDAPAPRAVPASAPAAPAVSAALPKAKAREPYEALQAELDACLTLSDLSRLWVSPAFKADYNKLPPDWQALVVERKDQCKAALQAQPPRVAPNFDQMETAHG